MFTLPVINVKADPLDALLAALGLRLQSLAKTGDNEAFNALIKDRDITICFLAPNVARYYHFDHGHFSQASAEAKNADLTINFTDSMTGVRLLTQADIAAFMTAIEENKVSISGDYKLILWFAGVGKQAISIPKEYQGYIEQAKPYAEQAKMVFSMLKNKLKK